MGNIYCAHCGWRLTLTTNGVRKKLLPDGTVQKTAKIRYECHYNIRHPGECDGQSGYSYKKVDDLVEKVIRMKFAEIKAAPAMEIVSRKHSHELMQIRKRLNTAEKELAAKQAEYDDLKVEAMKIIRGQSDMSMDFLNAMVKEAENNLNVAQDKVKAAELAKEELEASTESIKAEYQQLLTWADMYDKCSLEAKKMIVSQLIKSVKVGRGYNLEIAFNIAFEDFQQTVNTDETAIKTLEPKKEVEIPYMSFEDEIIRDEDLPTWDFNFTNKIVCGCCGKHYGYKTANGNPKWMCPTYSKYGKKACPSQAIPHAVLARLTAEMPYKNLTEIKAEKDQTMIFKFQDGTTITKHWQHQSRSERWWREKRYAAQQEAIARKAEIQSPAM